MRRAGQFVDLEGTCISSHSSARSWADLFRERWEAERVCDGR